MLDVLLGFVISSDVMEDIGEDENMVTLLQLFVLGNDTIAHGVEGVVTM